MGLELVRETYDSVGTLGELVLCVLGISLRDDDVGAVPTVHGKLYNVRGVVLPD